MVPGRSWSSLEPHLCRFHRKAAFYGNIHGEQVTMQTLPPLFLYRRTKYLSHHRMTLAQPYLQIKGN